MTYSEKEFFSDFDNFLEKYKSILSVFEVNQHFVNQFYENLSSSKNPHPNRQKISALVKEELLEIQSIHKNLQEKYKLLANLHLTLNYKPNFKEIQDNYNSNEFPKKI
ncbi:hypothetical protein [Paenibacillus hamazuiensis]|uniref:hypothetical protein n=1 Tax=Paenibacillus hamazuiensis TaxID=2936508 RepID=UPI00200E66A3|nr:hypothetical protein [Paenibacillus hamazuiensis]